MKWLDLTPLPAPQGIEPPLDENGRFACHLYCRHCRYDLRAMSSTVEVCPECGEPMAQSVDHYRRQWFSEEWLTRWQYGSQLMLWIITLAISVFLISGLGDSYLPWHLSNLLVQLVLLLMVWLSFKRHWLLRTPITGLNDPVPQMSLLLRDTVIDLAGPLLFGGLFWLSSILARLAYDNPFTGAVMFARLPLFILFLFSLEFMFQREAHFKIQQLRRLSAVPLKRRCLLAHLPLPGALACVIFVANYAEPVWNVLVADPIVAACLFAAFLIYSFFVVMRIAFLAGQLDAMIRTALITRVRAYDMLEGPAGLELRPPVRLVNLRLLAKSFRKSLDGRQVTSRSKYAAQAE